MKRDVDPSTSSLTLDRDSVKGVNLTGDDCPNGPKTRPITMGIDRNTEALSRLARGTSFITILIAIRHQVPTPKLKILI
ncbi:uncharacterized protein N7459_002995 [Penicillium hispanicum]|uniref:uncharacterized protein n=1 Tax=Penicillium hispanicum TaxID=1080232 RepID=UPI002541A065|nr:uncharacterized protein N7459_002995 [Penicillium hispanicum]KAJ5587230.1 hypothetical protein N7459_002995 [Penicillium hispanicum]